MGLLRALDSQFGIFWICRSKFGVGRLTGSLSVSNLRVEYNSMDRFFALPTDNPETAAILCVYNRGYKTTAARSSTLSFPASVKERNFLEICPGSSTASAAMTVLEGVQKVVTLVACSIGKVYRLTMRHCTSCSTTRMHGCPSTRTRPVDPTHSFSRTLRSRSKTHAYHNV